MSDDTTRPNYAALHIAELRETIDSAPPDILESIDEDLAREGWAADGVARSRINERLTDLGLR